MLKIPGQAAKNCAGVTRRSLLRAGVLGVGGLGLTLADYQRARAGFTSDPTQRSSADRSVILIWLDGGPPQHETYDPKPDAPAEFRGPLGAVTTKVPGVWVNEHLTRHAALMDKISLVRSVHHNNGDHFAAAHWMLTGYLGSNAVNLPAQYPSFGSVISKIQGAKSPHMPAYVGLPQTHSVGLAPGYHGGAYLGVANNPFTVDGDPNQDGYAVPNLNLPAGLNAPRMEDRKQLLAAFDAGRRDIDQSGLMDGLDRFTQDAYSLITGPEARAAFQIQNEDPRLREKYGRHTWGQSALMARRLVEVGVRFVTLTFGGWDWHSNIKQGMDTQLPIIDNAIGGLIDDLDQRGMLDQTMVIVMGEFGRTPRINNTAGRDHWGDVMSVLMAGGGLKPGVVVGSSNRKGETVKDRPITPADILVTVYHQLGINPETIFINRSGRPVPIGANGTAIHELV